MFYEIGAAQCVWCLYVKQSISNDACVCGKVDRLPVSYQIPDKPTFINLRTGNLLAVLLLDPRGDMGTPRDGHEQAADDVGGVHSGGGELVDWER